MGVYISSVVRLCWYMTAVRACENERGGAALSLVRVDAILHCAYTVQYTVRRRAAMPRWLLGSLRRQPMLVVVARDNNLPLLRHRDRGRSAV